MGPAKVGRSEVPLLEDGVTAVVPHSLHRSHSHDSHAGIRSMSCVQQDIVPVIEVEGGTGPVAAVAAIWVDFTCSDDIGRARRRGAGVMICDIKEEENCREQTHDDNWTLKRPEDTCVLEDIIIALCSFHSSVFD